MEAQLNSFTVNLYLHVSYDFQFKLGSRKVNQRSPKLLNHIGAIAIEVKTVPIRFPLFLTGTSKLETSDLLNVCVRAHFTNSQYHN